MLNTIKSIIEKQLCNSCGACFVVCPQNAITFKETLLGDMLPSIDETKCSNCGLCIKICPRENFQLLTDSRFNDNFAGNNIKSFIGVSSNQTIYNNSQSGGVVTGILSSLLNEGLIKGAILVSMTKGSPPRPSYILAKKEEELISAQKSKYTPIPLLAALKKYKNIDYPLAIVGLPCHFHGLYNISKMFPEIQKNIKYKIGLICGGVMLYSSMDYLIRKSRKRFTNEWEIIYRDKSAGGYPGNIRISDNNKTVILKKKYRISIKDYFISPNCRICFDKMNIFSDITVGDPWGIKSFSYKNGSSVCVARNQRGIKVIEDGIKKKYLDLQEIDYNRIVEGQQIELKKKEFNDYINAWLVLKGDVPSYCNLLGVEKDLSVTSLCLEKLKFSFTLNQLSSLELAFNKIDKKIHKKEKFRVLKNLLKLKG